MKLSLITIYGSNVPSKPLSVEASMVFTRADHLFIHNYIKSLSKYNVKTYFNGQDEARTRVLLLVCLTHQPTEPHRQYIYKIKHINIPYHYSI